MKGPLTWPMRTMMIMLILKDKIQAFSSYEEGKRWFQWHWQWQCCVQRKWRFGLMNSWSSDSHCHCDCKMSLISQIIESFHGQVKSYVKASAT